MARVKDADPVTVVIEDLTHDGLGVADIGGRRAFVAGALPGETVRLGRQRRRRKLIDAELLEIIEPSPDRVEPDCEYFGRCGGCALQHMSYPAQVSFKQKGRRRCVYLDCEARAAPLARAGYRTPMALPAPGASGHQIRCRQGTRAGRVPRARCPADYRHVALPRARAGGRSGP
jgi:tRNA/tmRNA/rRNA uracil-C5-methylase (TrmA/RlmC/RlmD family)